MAAEETKRPGRKYVSRTGYKNVLFSREGTRLFLVIPDITKAVLGADGKPEMSKSGKSEVIARDNGSKGWTDFEIDGKIYGLQIRLFKPISEAIRKEEPEVVMEF